MRCAYLTMDDLGAYVSDADLSLPAMEACGWAVDKLSWTRSDVDWDEYDMVYVCTPWDYHERLDEFLPVIDRIAAADTVLANPAETIRWNADKRYLRDLEAAGHAIVPSRWQEDYSAVATEAAFEAFASERIVIKPCVAACAMDTFVLRRGEPPPVDLESLYRGRPHFLQPFIDSVQSVGEYSLFFFDGDYSHAILKTPRAGDFRVQEEFGSDIRRIDAAEDMIAQAASVVASLEPAVAYARVDYVEDAAGAWRIMELELIEPSLYFRCDPESADRFAAAMTRYYQRLRT